MNIWAFALGLATLIIGPTSIFAVWINQRSKAPVTRAEAAEAVVVNTMDPSTKIVVDSLSQQLGKQAADHAAAIAEVRGEMAEVRDRLSAVEVVLTRWRAFGNDLVTRWPEHRARETPPTLPEP